jgi:hypothetical protein
LRQIRTLAEQGLVSQTELQQAKVDALRSRSEQEQLEVLFRLVQSSASSATVEAGQLLDGFNMPKLEPPQPGSPTLQQQMLQQQWTRPAGLHSPWHGAGQRP